jgi:hypothetical protein
MITLETLRTVVGTLVAVLFCGFAASCVAQIWLTRSILKILRDVAPEIEKGLTIHTGNVSIDSMLSVRPVRFQTFVRSNNAPKEPRLARRIAQYKLAHRVGIGIWFVFAAFMLVLMLRSWFQ